jgi:hypothetical protein
METKPTLLQHSERILNSCALLKIYSCNFNHTFMYRLDWRKNKLLLLYYYYYISWAAWVLRSLEDCMEERQHHLNESSSARLGRSQKLEILPSPNSKSLVAYFLIDAYTFDRRRDFNIRLVYIVYYVGTHILQFRIARTHIFWICAHILDMRIYFEHGHIFWICAYILKRCIHFGKAHIFWASAYILTDANILCIC